MLTFLRTIVSGLLVAFLASTGGSQAQDYLAIETYKCAEFLADSAKPDEPGKLMRSLITIAWATGFAASNQQTTLRADAKAMRLIAIIAGDACRKAPEKVAIVAISQTIQSLVTAQRKK